MRIYINKVCLKIEYSFILMIAFALIAKAENLLFLLIFSMLHEAGHIIVLFFLKGRPEELTFAFYGVALKHKSNLSASQSVAFLSGGIIVNLIFSILNVKREINIPLLIINSLPLYPLDGGRIFRIVFERYFPFGDRVFRGITYLFVLSLFAYSVCYKNISLILISVYAFIFVINNSLD